MRGHLRIFAAMLSVFALLAASVVGAAASPSSNTVVQVTNGSIDGVHWSTNDTREGGSVSFVFGPGVAPLGAGSLQLNTTDAYGTSQAKAQLFNYDWIGTPLADISDVSFQGYVSGQNTAGADAYPSINIEIDPNDGTHNFTTLVWEEYRAYPTSDVQPDTWQTWDTFGMNADNTDQNAGWWCTTSAHYTTPAICGQSNRLTWNDIVAALPHAYIVGGFGLNVGSGWSGTFQGNVDALSLTVSGNTTTYDFEPNSAATLSGPPMTVRQGFWALIRVEAVGPDGQNISSRGLPVTVVELDGPGGQIIPFTERLRFAHFAGDPGYQAIVNTRDLAIGTWTMQLRIGAGSNAVAGYATFTVE